MSKDRGVRKIRVRDKSELMPPSFNEKSETIKIRQRGRPKKFEIENDVKQKLGRKKSSLLIPIQDVKTRGVRGRKVKNQHPAWVKLPVEKTSGDNKNKSIDLTGSEDEKSPPSKKRAQAQTEKSDLQAKKRVRVDTKKADTTSTPSTSTPVTKSIEIVRNRKTYSASTSKNVQNTIIDKLPVICLDKIDHTALKDNSLDVKTNVRQSINKTVLNQSVFVDVEDEINKVSQPVSEEINEGFSASIVCRVCGVAGSNRFSLIGVQSERLNLVQHLKSYLRIEVYEEDKFPLYICPMCAQTLQYFHKFVSRSTSTTKRLQAIINESCRNNPDDWDQVPWYGDNLIATATASTDYLTRKHLREQEKEKSPQKNNKTTSFQTTRIEDLFGKGDGLQANTTFNKLSTSVTSTPTVSISQSVRNASQTGNLLQQVSTTQLPVSHIINPSNNIFTITGASGSQQQQSPASFIIGQTVDNKAILVPATNLIPLNTQQIITPGAQPIILNSSLTNKSVVKPSVVKPANASPGIKIKDVKSNAPKPTQDPLSIEKPTSPVFETVLLNSPPKEQVESSTPTSTSTSSNVPIIFKKRKSTPQLINLVQPAQKVTPVKSSPILKQSLQIKSLEVKKTTATTPTKTSAAVSLLKPVEDPDVMIVEPTEARKKYNVSQMHMDLVQKFVPPHKDDKYTYVVRIDRDNGQQPYFILTANPIKLKTPKLTLCNTGIISKEIYKSEVDKKKNDATTGGSLSNIGSHCWAQHIVWLNQLKLTGLVEFYVKQSADRILKLGRELCTEQAALQTSKVLKNLYTVIPTPASIGAAKTTTTPAISGVISSPTTHNKPTISSQSPRTINIVTKSPINKKVVLNSKDISSGEKIILIPVTKPSAETLKKSKNIIKLPVTLPNKRVVVTSSPETIAVNDDNKSVVKASSTEPIEFVYQTESDERYDMECVSEDDEITNENNDCVEKTPKKSDNDSNSKESSSHTKSNVQINLDDIVQEAVKEI